MTAIGYTLSSEENGARELVAHARRAEEVGFPFAVISDHFHPWIDRQDGFLDFCAREILPRF